MIEKSFVFFFHLVNKGAVLSQSDALSRGHFQREICPKEGTLGWYLENRNWSPCLSLPSQREREGPLGSSEPQFPLLSMGKQTSELGKVFVCKAIHRALTILL